MHGRGPNSKMHTQLRTVKEDKGKDVLAINIAAKDVIRPVHK